MKELFFGFVSTLWAIGSMLMRLLYDLNLLKRIRLSVPVISIGNIQVGGAGKTPLTILVAREFLKLGKTPVILTRGYQSIAEDQFKVIAPSEKEVSVDWVGDEAALLHDQVNEAWIGVGSDRAFSFKKVCDEMKKVGVSPSVAILDDGFQHHRIERDIDLVAVTDLEWGEAIFRDFFSVLNRKGVLKVFTKGDISKSPGHDFSVNWIYPTPEPSIRYHLVTGIASPEKARSSLLKQGFNIVKHLEFRDHARYDRSYVQGVIDFAQEQGMRVLLTGKDWVKWRDLGVKKEQVTCVEPRLEFVEREAFLKILPLSS